ncbi:hypothetical protein LDENG_00059580 [Lucifuga dentata]|nr:hypothetical protein LDENG_00059580 [Lucifuga dentata]
MAALESTKEGWGTCIISRSTNEIKPMKVDVEELLLGCTLKGAYFGGWKTVESVPKLVDDFMNKKLKLDEFVTHNLSLDQTDKAFQLLTDGKR